MRQVTISELTVVRPHFIALIRLPEQTPIWIQANQVELIEESDAFPSGSILTLVSGRKRCVMSSPDEVIKRFENA